MKIVNHLFAIAVVVLIIQSCATVNMKSNKQANYYKQPKKIYIVTNCDGDYKEFCMGVMNGLKDNLAKKGIKANGYLRDALSLDSDGEINKKITDYSPEAVLSIKQTLTGDGIAAFELTLIDGETKKNVWKGSFDLAVGYYSTAEDQGVINKSVKAIMDQLILDKII
jgi:hypothetical protein